MIHKHFLPSKQQWLKREKGQARKKETWTKRSFVFEKNCKWEKRESSAFPFQFFTRANFFFSSLSKKKNYLKREKKEKAWKEELLEKRDKVSLFSKRIANGKKEKALLFEKKNVVFLYKMIHALRGFPRKVQKTSLLSFLFNSLRDERKEKKL